MKKGYQEKITRIQNAIKGQKNDRVPIILPLRTWVSDYYGVSGEDFYRATDPDKVVELYMKAFEEFDYDALIHVSDISTMCAAEAVDGSNQCFGPAGLQFKNEIFPMKENEYRILADKGFYNYIRDYVLARKCKKLQEDKATALNALQKAFGLLRAKGQVYLEIEKRIEDAGCPVIFPETGGRILVHPLCVITGYLRGTASALIDMRRHPEEMKAALDSLQCSLTYGFNQEHHDDCHGIFWPIVSTPFLNPKQYEKFFAPYFNELINLCVTNRVYTNVFFEGCWKPFYDQMQEMPDNDYIIGTLEIGDYKEFKDTLGRKIIPYGGLHCTTLGRGSLENNINSVKKLIDDCAPGGRFIIGTDMYLLNKEDANPENLKAVINTIKEYGRY